MLIKEEMNENNSSKVGKYIQRINAIPLTITCFTEEGVRLYHKLATKGTLYLDATGTIVSLRKTSFESRRMLYYALVMRHPKDGHPPIAAAEFLTQDYTVLAISHFLVTL